MILLFLISLGLLLYAILGEVDASRQAEPAAVRAPCPVCGQEVEADWLVCPRCRRFLKTSCSGCGRMNFAEWEFCHACGEEQKGKPHGG